MVRDAQETRLTLAVNLENGRLDFLEGCVAVGVTIEYGESLTDEIVSDERATMAKSTHLLRRLAVREAARDVLEQKGRAVRRAEREVNTTSKLLRLVGRGESGDDH